MTLEKRVGNEEKGREDMHDIYIFVCVYCIREIILGRSRGLAQRESLVMEKRGLDEGNALE